MLEICPDSQHEKNDIFVNFFPQVTKIFSVLNTEERELFPGLTTRNW